MSSFKLNNYTIEDIYALPDGQRAELIDGQMYNMPMPNTIHQELVLELCCTIGNYIDENHCSSKVCLSPFAVFINKDEKNYVEPDVFVVCDFNKLDDRGCNGAPDFIIEIVLPSSQRMDYLIKLFKYREAGVREYWIVNPITQTVQTYYFDDAEDANQYSFDEEITVGIYSDLKICIADLLK